MRALTQEPEETYKTQAVSGSYKSWLWGPGVGSQWIHMQTHTCKQCVSPWEVFWGAKESESRIYNDGSTVLIFIRVWREFWSEAKIEIVWE